MGKPAPSGGRVDAARPLFLIGRFADRSDADEIEAHSPTRLSRPCRCAWSTTVPVIAVYPSLQCRLMPSNADAYRRLSSPETTIR